MPAVSDFQSNVVYLDATIAASGTKTAAIDLGGCTLTGIFLPATFDGTTITFEAAPALDGTFVAVEDGAASPASVTLTVTGASKYVGVPQAAQALLRGLRFIKIVTGTTQSTTDTVLTLAARP